MSKGPEAFRTISEVAEELNIPQHVLRFWETRFTQIKPVKRGGGRRFYRPDDVALLAGIRHLLYGAGYTIRGVQQILKEQGVAHVQGLVDSPAYDSSASVAAVTEALELHDRSAQHSLDLEATFGGHTLPDIDMLLPDHLDAREVLSENAISNYGMDVEATHSEEAFSTPQADAYSGSPLYAAPSSAPPVSDIDARAATVSAAYAALTSANMPLHPRDGFVRPEDYQVEAEETDASISSATSNQYSPGPLTIGAGTGRQPPRIPPAHTGSDDKGTDYIIQPQYRLTTGTRENLQSVLEELRECRRLLGSALNRQPD